MLNSIADFLAIKAAKPVSSFAVPASLAIATLPISKSAIKPTKTAARPTRACIPATSSGICVISTLDASIYPMIPPPAMSIIEKNHKPEPGPIKVAKTAKAIPTIPYQTARLALSCPDNPPKERMKRIAATT